MRTIWIATAGILGASLLFAIYMHFAAIGARNQASGVANHEQEAGGAEQPVPAAESAQPPAPVAEQPAEQPATALNAPEPAEGRTPVATAERRPAAGQPVMRRQHSSAVRETSASPSEEPRASRRENSSQASSDSATQNQPLVTQAALQPPAPPALPTQSDVPPATAPFAKLYVNGNVLVNGHLSGESNLFAGDWVDTPEGTEATVVGENFEAVLRAGSRLSVDQSGIELARGDVLVTTTAGTSVKTNTVRVTPQTSPNAKFEVFDQTEGVKVMTYQGSVMVQ